MLEDDAAPDQSQAQAVGKKQKRFQCERCQRMFARLEHLQRHERTHTQEKPFSCQKCDHRFTRSDLLVRHERLSHGANNVQDAQNGNGTENDQTTGNRNKRRRTTANGEVEKHEQQAMSPVGSITMDVRRTSVSTNPYLEQNGGFALGGSLATLSMAAEQAAMQDDFATTPAMPTFGMPPAVPHLQNPQVQSDPVHPSQPDTMTMPFAPQDPGLDFGVDFGDSLDNLAMMWDSGPHSSYPFASLLTTEQPVPFFSPDFSNYGTEFVGGTGSGTQRFTTHNDEPSSFSRFGSRLPSLQPEEKAVEHQPPAPRHFSEVSPEDRQYVAAQLMHFQATLPQDFQLPTRLALSRYLAAYINGFHEHLPFLHIPTMSIERCSIELVLAMAAIGAQYCFEGEKGVELFNASQAIAIHRIRRRDARLAAFHRRAEAEVPASTPGADCASGMGGRFPSIESFRHSNSGPLGLPTEPDPSDGSEVVREDLMQTAQALLLLMAMATWAKHKEILREALAIQSVLATLVRDDGLKSEPIQDSVAWEEWVRAETIKRTKFIVFCFFNLHCIVYNIPPLILNSELNLQLPCSAVEFKAGNAAQWREARKKAVRGTGFHQALSRLFSRGGKDITEWNSSLGNYVLIHALIQHIFFLRQTARCRFDRNGDLSPEDVSSLEQALRNWQLGWRRNPESSLDPMDPNGPVAFNSTALLRLAYIRLNVDTGPGRALDTRDPVQIAHAFNESPAIKRTPKLVRAVLHSAHALSIPVKIGVHLVARTQTFIWSIQHSLCSLECAFLLSKWLEALSLPDPDPPVTEDERRICSLVKTMLDETEFAVSTDSALESPETIKHLSAGVLRVWATIFRGAQTWAIVDVIGSSLDIYAGMLETS